MAIMVDASTVTTVRPSSAVVNCLPIPTVMMNWSLSDARRRACGGSNYLQAASVVNSSDEASLSFGESLVEILIKSTTAPA
jgi:hypothetical protein